MHLWIREKTYSLALLIQYLVGTIMHGIWLINEDSKMQNVSQWSRMLSEWHSSFNIILYKIFASVILYSKFSWNNNRIHNLIMYYIFLSNDLQIFQNL